MMTSSETPRRERVRLIQARLVPTPDAQTKAEVALEWHGSEYRGEASGVGHGIVELRLCAQATLNALVRLLGTGTEFRLIGVKSVKAFDDLVAIVGVTARDVGTGASHRLIGTAPVIEDGIPEGVARAVLNATNRYLGNILAALD